MSGKMQTLLDIIRILIEIFFKDRPDDKPVEPEPVPPPANDPPQDPTPNPPPIIPIPPVPGKDDLAVLRADLLARHNKVRKDNGKKELWSLGELDKIAQDQAEYQAKINGWRDLHGRPPGKSLKSDLQKLTYDYRVGGENAAAGQATALDAVTGWKNSRGHFANMIKDNYLYVGFGYAKSSKGTNYWIAIFVG